MSCFPVTCCATWNAHFALDERLCVQGSGKSTFALQLQQYDPAAWKRINQDSLKTRKKCVAHMDRALSSGQHCIVDRCNFDREQRRTWLDIASQRGVPCYAVWLAVPRDVAAQRARDRLVHEGHVTGPEAAGMSRSIHGKIMGAPLHDTARSRVNALLQCGP